MNEAISYWLDIETEAGELVESLRSSSSLEALQKFTSGLPVQSSQATASAQDFSITIGSVLVVDEKEFRVKDISVGIRDAKRYAEIRIYVTVEKV